MAPGEGARRVHFAVQQQGAYAYAIQLRLTPALLEALLAAQDAGRAASICFGEVPQSNVSVHAAIEGGGPAVEAGPCCCQQTASPASLTSRGALIPDTSSFA